LTGVLTAVLILAGSANAAQLEYLPAADRALEIYSDNPTRVMADGYLGLIAAFTLIWFAGSVYADLRQREGGIGRLSMLAFGAGVASGLTIGAGYTVKVAAAARAGAPGGLDPIAAVSSFDLYSAFLGNLSAFTFAAFIGAAAAVWLRTGMSPRWTGWASVILVIGLLSPVGYLFVAFALVWMIAVSIWLYRRGAASVAASPAPSAA
jgi:hypothetical protein